MDAVITYVDNTVKEWQNSWYKAIGRPWQPVRFREWGTLRYLLRGIAEYMPFIEKVHLVVCQRSQVPAWVNRRTVNVVLHKDIIPEELLPTFNSNVIEFFFHNIKGLGNEFVYFNDDMFPVAPCVPEDFFEDGKIRSKVGVAKNATTMFQQYCRNATELALDLAGRPRLQGRDYFRIRHSVSPMRLDLYREVVELGHDRLWMSFTRLRDWVNICQHVFIYYANLKGECTGRPLSSKYIALSSATSAVATDAILHPQAKLLCLNDCCEHDRYESVRATVTEAFESALPSKCRFDI